MPLKLCTGCKARFDRDKMIGLPVGKFHSMDCAIAYANKKTTAAANRRLKRAAVDEKKERKAIKDKHRSDKERAKTKAKWLSELQAVVNKYIRLRDAHLGCVSCDKPRTWGGQWHASHYYSRGHSSALRFNLWNIHKSCSICNGHMSGNIMEYTPRLIEKIGRDKFDWLTEHKSDVARYDVKWIKRAIRIGRKAVKKAESKYN